MNKFKVYVNSENEKWLSTLIIGDKYKKDFEKYCLDLAVEYCKKNGFGLCAVIDDIDDNTFEHAKGKKKTWQKFLIPIALSNYLKKHITLCYFDSDILFNPFGKNIFSYHCQSTVSIVSQINNLPYDHKLAQRIISFNRHHFYSSDYPLDSAIHMDTQDNYEVHGFEPYDDISCAGLYIIDTAEHADSFADIYNSYTNDVSTLTGGGDEPVFNYELRKRFKINTIPYEFQAIWIYEMAWSYAHLYDRNKVNEIDIASCIASKLLCVTALHFAGSWYESEMYKTKGIVRTVLSQFNSEFAKYLETQVTGQPAGRVMPNRGKA